MGINIKISDAKKAYGDNVVIHNLSLDINGGELFTLLGPSGCGKTTLLRMIAGFNTIENGDFYFNEQRINDLEPAKRNIGMVFQNYAIFPHFTVRKNVEYGLKNKRLPKDQIQSRADEFLSLMKIKEYENRLPEHLSGGQQQRVALARALAIHPDVLLMDEPLSNLDAKLRVEMRNVIREIQKNVNITTVYVTHDQEEAMAISDRIAVMNEGDIQQIGTPKMLYQRPKNLFVATFIGRTNVLKGQIVKDDLETSVLFDGNKIVLNNLVPHIENGEKVKLSIRPEEFYVDEDVSVSSIHGTVEDSIFLGLNTHYFIKLKNNEKIEVIQESTIDSIIQPGTEIALRINEKKINIFTEDGSQSLILGVDGGYDV